MPTVLRSASSTSRTHRSVPARVAHLTSVHYPFDSRIFYKECRSLAASGYDVTLVAPHDKEEVVDGVRVVPVTRARRRRERFWRVDLEVLRTALALDADLYHFHDPELIPAGLLLKARGKRVVYDTHEDLPRDVIDKAWIRPAWLRALVSAALAVVEAGAVRCLDGVVCPTPAIHRRFPPKKAALVRNFPILGELASQAQTGYRDRAFAAVYVGGITASRGAKEMVQAAALLPESRSPSLVLAGETDDQGLCTELQTLPGWERVRALGWVDRQGVARALSEARVGLVALHPTRAYQEAYPVKLFEYMAAGLPVVASDFPLWRGIVDGAGCGLLVDPLDPGALARAVEWLFAHPDEAEIMGRRGSEAVDEAYRWDFEAETLRALYARLLGSPP